MTQLPTPGATPAAPPPAEPLPTAARPRPRWRETLGLLVRNPTAAVSAVVLVLVVLVAVFDETIAPDGPNDQDPSRQLQPPSWDHPFGTDEFGRDVFSRVILGAATSLRVGFLSVAFALVVGTLIGLLAGFYGRWVDDTLMRLMDVLFAFPAVLLAIAIVAIRGAGPANAILAIGIVYVPIFARVTRASVLGVREEVYVRASRSVGASDWRLVTRHVLPNAAPPIIVQTSISLAFAVLAEAALSFLGLGPRRPNPSWGLMLADGRGFIEQAWWYAVFPGLAIVVTVLCFNLLGDGLRDVLDPRQRTLMAGGAR